ncbi:PAS domain-containing sensor histidine kinase [Methylomagnum ishizawai]|uniref:PAS domain-containing sensor histidine kinase n=1 Tax=Methylomagnum ishizawai TaxID=1760988 RepID=UPI001C329033|nr:PAS domain S-box protein [Methylomagnum ishizawai]BBL77130.1 hypothetical protein MishRS11D_42280 [Methylomagnum ishizawai]
MSSPIQSPGAEALRYFDASPVPMYLLWRGDDGGTELIHANPRFRAVGGAPLPVGGEPGFWAAHIHPEDWPQVIGPLVGLEAGGEVELEYRCRPGHGQEEYIRVRDRFAAHRAGPGGMEILAVRLDIPDAGERTGPGEAGQCREALYRSAIQGSPDAYFVLDGQGRIQEWSPRAESMFGYTQEEVRGRPLEQAIQPRGNPGEPEDVFVRFLRTCLEQGSGRRRRFIARQRDGSGMPVEIQASQLELGGQRCYTGFIRDISDRLLAEGRWVQAQKLEAIGQLTSGLCHDFNNILSIVIGSLELLNEPLTAMERRQVVQSALTAAERGVEVTRSLLAVARRQPLEARDVNINALLRELEPLIRQTAGKAVQVEVAPLAVDAIAHIDQGGFSNAILNLVINARDAMPQGGALCVYTHWLGLLEHQETAPELPPGEYIAIGVDDTGAGMSPGVAARAFDPFFTTKERGKGTGLGLAMVYGFARQSGGTAQIQSVPGKGTLVTLLLPVVATPRQSLPLVDVRHEGEGGWPAPET